MPRVPFGFKAEYRGVKPSGEFLDDGGERVEYGPKLKFEIELPDGDVEVVGISAKSLDKVCEFDCAKLAKGEVLWMEGVVAYGDGYAGIKPMSVRKMTAADLKDVAAA